MTSEMTKKAYYGIRDGKKGSLGLGMWSKRLIMSSKMVKKDNQDVRDGKTENYGVSDNQKGSIWYQRQ